MVVRKNTRSVVALNNQIFDGSQLSLVGLNLQAIFNIQNLPTHIIQQLRNNSKNLEHFSQLILIGHAGRLLWQKLKESNFQSTNPIDNFSRHHAEKFFSKRFGAEEFEILFPSVTVSNHPIGLQTLGVIAGWHNQSPFRVGINQQWGSWFAYRAIILVKSNYQPSALKYRELSPCISCQTKDCITACPANALIDEDLNLQLCIQYRVQEGSKCNDRCIARMACPVAKTHQYPIEQIQYHYSQSMKIIEKLKP